jgi:hypothetical protein
MKRILPVLIILASLFLLFSKLTDNNRGHIFSTTSPSFNNKKILQVVSHNEKNCLFWCGTVYVFQTPRNGSWQEITSFRSDKAIEFPNRNLKIENEDFAYFSIGWKFGVTTDGGRNWSIWNAEDNDLMKNALDYDLIEKVTVEEDGRGKMFFNSIGKDRSGISSLRTEDYGKTWHR